MPDADLIGAIVLIVAAALMLVWGILRHLAKWGPIDYPQDFTPEEVSECERRYHSSDQFGR